MFVNKTSENRTVDEERGLELRFVDAGPERPSQYVLVRSGTPIGFTASVRTIERPNRGRALIWTVHNVGRFYHESRWVGDRWSMHGVPGYRFVDAADRAAVLAIIDEALHVYGDLTGRDTTPVDAVVFEAAAKGA